MDERYQIIPIDRGGWRIQEENVRAFLFTGTKRALLVDSGCGIDNMKQIVSGLTRLPVTVVNTHSDHDHIACNGQFDQVLMHPAELALYHKVRGQTAAVQPVWDGDVIDLGGRRFQVVAVPGHTSGSIALLDRENRILVGGDGVQDWRIFLFGPGRDLWAYLHSLERLERLSGGFDQVYPAHGSFPVSSAILSKLIRGTKKVLAGEVPGRPAFYEDTPIMEYDIGAATLLLERTWPNVN